MRARESLHGSALAVAGILLTACAGSDNPTNAIGVFQIGETSISPTTVTCGSQPADTWTALFHLELINTTRDAITVSNVSSNGVIVNATLPEELGRAALIFNNLPYTPEGAVVRARDGNIAIVVTIKAACGPHPAPNTVVFRDVLTTIRVTTSSGQYVSPERNLRILFLSGL
jgi:hypothetical protein